MCGSSSERKASSGLGSAVHRTSLGFLHMIRTGSVLEEERKEVEKGWREVGREGRRKGEWGGKEGRENEYLLILWSY